jgi:cytosine/adenosine deaminase-related metal-dependent hydrolase
MFQEMRLALNLHRVPGIEEGFPSALDVFRMATIDGARATGFDGIGTLEPGKRADIVLLDLQHVEEPFLDPEVSILDAVVHRGRAQDVDTVIVAGEIVLRGRQLTRVDKVALFRELRKALDRPLNTDEIERRTLTARLEPYMRRFYTDVPRDALSPHYAYNNRT